MKDGILGLNSDMFREYLEYIANRRFSQIGMSEEYPGATTPFPWMSEMIDLKKENFLRPESPSIKQVVLLIGMMSKISSVSNKKGGFAPFLLSAAFLKCFSFSPLIPVLRTVGIVLSS